MKKPIHCSLLLFLFFVFPPAHAQRRKVDSLNLLLVHDKPDSIRADHLNALGWAYRNLNHDSAFLFTKNAMALSQKINWGKGIALAYHQSGAFNSDEGNFEAALDLYAKALHIWDSIETALTSQNSNTGRYFKKIMRLKSLTIYNIGNVYIGQADYPRALDQHFRSLKIDETLIGSNDRELDSLGKLGVARNYGAIAGIYLLEKKYPKSLEFFLNAIKTGEKIAPDFLSTWYGNIGLVYYEQKIYDKALEYHLKALHLDEKEGNKNGIARHYGNIALVYSEMPDSAFQKLGHKVSERFEFTLDYFLKSVAIAKEMDDQERIAIQYGNIGNLYMAKAKKESNSVTRQQLYKQAEDYFSRSVKLSGEIGDLYGIMEVNQNLSDLYYALGQEGFGRTDTNYLRAYEHYKRFSKAKDSIFNEEKNKEITQHEMTYEFEKKEAFAKAEQEKKDAVARAESHKQRIVIALVACVLLLVLVSAAFIFRSLQVTRKQKGIIEKQKEVVDRKNSLITDSITYALTIQESILPPEEHFRSAFSESFILFLPKDIVSGDFYWIRHLGGEVLLAAVDCTGHGVPGAFMSLHGYNHLENIVNEKKIRDPHHILDELNKAVVETLNHDDSDVVKHGMDMSLVKFVRGTSELHFSGAKNGIYIISGTEFLELKADRVSVGNKFGKNFSAQNMTLKKGDMVYLFSDGFMDQKGGPEGKRLQVSPFKELLKKNAHLNCSDQKKQIHDAFLSWKGSYEQIDDVMVIGVRV